MIYLVCLVDEHGELTPLVAFYSEDVANQVAERMGRSGVVLSIPLADEER